MVRNFAAGYGGRLRRGLLFATAIVVLAGVYAWFAQPVSTPPAGPLERIVIATNTAYVGSCPVTAARELGYFLHEGLEVVVQPHSSGKASMDAVLQGKANLGTVADIPIMFAGLNSRPVAVIATIFKTEKDHGIVGRRDRGIAEPASLKGKRIGVTLSTSGHFTLDAFLNRQRLAPGDVTMHNYQPEALVGALVKGEVDAVAAWEPFMAQMQQQLGANAVMFYGQDVYESIYNIAGMRDYIAARPATVQKVLRALRQGAQFCSDNPAQAYALLKTATKSDMPNVLSAWPAYHFSIVLDQGLILALEDEARWAIKNGLTSRTDIPNYLELVYLDGLEAVMPSAVTIIH